MKLSEAALRRVTDSMAFRASAAAYLVLDCDLRIRAANHSYELATMHPCADMVGEFMFDVFPDNPETPLAHGVRNLEHSLEAVLRRKAGHRMGLQRYDVRDPSSGLFVDKTWLPVNSPVLDADGKTVAILHHVEDVSHLLLATSLELQVSRPEGTAAAEPAVVPDVSGLVERVRRDALSRQRSAGAMFTRSVEAMERAERRLVALQTSSQASLLPAGDGDGTGGRTPGRARRARPGVSAGRRGGG